jgi:hypothetical protein
MKVSTVSHRQAVVNGLLCARRLQRLVLGGARAFDLDIAVDILRGDGNGTTSNFADGGPC